MGEDNFPLRGCSISTLSTLMKRKTVSPTKYKMFRKNYDLNVQWYFYIKLNLVWLNTMHFVHIYTLSLSTFIEFSSVHSKIIYRLKIGFVALSDIFCELSSLHFSSLNFDLKAELCFGTETFIEILEYYKITKGMRKKDFWYIRSIVTWFTTSFHALPCWNPAFWSWVRVKGMWLRVCFFVFFLFF